MYTGNMKMGYNAGSPILSFITSSPRALTHRCRVIGAPKIVLLCCFLPSPFFLVHSMATAPEGGWNEKEGIKRL
eukprot:103698-Rhodomonas_salina.1